MMALQKVVKICEDEGCQPIILPVDEDDGSLPLSSLKKMVPNAIGLWYYTESDTIRGVKMANGKFYPPFNGWGNAIYYCATLSETNADDNQDDSEGTKGIVSIDNIRIPEKSDTQSVDQNVLRGIRKAVNSSTFTSYADDDKKIPTARRPHRCDICGTCFTQQSHMLRHRRIHTGEKPFACDRCSERFSRSDKLKLHFDRCHMAPIAMLDQPRNESAAPIKDKREKKPRILDDAYDWSIRAPSASSSTSPTKTKHLTVRFKKTANIDLDNGQDGYYSVVNMAEVEMEDDEPVSIVPVALAEIKKDEPEVSPQPQEPEFIDPSEAGSDDKPYRCEECCKPFAKRNQLQRHMRIHTGERPFQCEICMKSFTRVDALKRHMASMGHQKQKEQSDVDVEAVTEILIDTYPDILPNGMEMDPLIDDHSNLPLVETVDEDNDSEAHCDVASFAQVTYSNLESANSAKQETEETTKTNCKKVSQGKENYCQQCNHAFTNKFNYNLHMESHKKVAKTYKCTYCDYVFRRQSHLTRHILIHTGEKPFECKHCDERFSRSDKLKLHVKRTHTGLYGNSTMKPPIQIDHS